MGATAARALLDAACTESTRAQRRKEKQEFLACRAADLRLDTIDCSKITFLHLTPLEHLRIVWAIVAGNACMNAVCNISATCFELWSAVTDSWHQLWHWKLRCILGEDASDLDRYTAGLLAQLQLSRSRGLVDASAAPHRYLCICLLAADRFFRSAVTACDWLALFDAGEVLRVAGVTSAPLCLLVLSSLIAFQQRPIPLQALQWLWDLAVSVLKPWSGSARPNAEVVGLDDFRSWLQMHLSVATKPWHKNHAFSLSDSYDGLFSQSDHELLAPRVGVMAAFFLLAIECRGNCAIALRPSGPSRESLCAVVSTAELAAGIEAAILYSVNCDDDRKRHAADKLWSLVLLLFARCYRSRQAPWMQPHNKGKDASGAAGPTPWNGLSITWSSSTTEARVAHASRTGRLQEDDDYLVPPLPPPPPELPVCLDGSEVPIDLEELYFPAVDVDQRRGWLHTQHGELRPSQRARDTGSDIGTVQFDVRFDAISRCFLGTWVNRRSGARAQTLPARVFALDVQHGGLRQWISASVPHLRLDAGSAPSARFTELIGIVGEPREAGFGHDVLRCFHLYCDIHAR